MRALLMEETSWPVRCLGVRVGKGSSGGRLRARVAMQMVTDGQGLRALVIERTLADWHTCHVANALHVRL